MTRQLSACLIALSCLGPLACVEPTGELPDAAVELDGGGMQTGTDGGEQDGGTTVPDAGLEDGGVEDGGVEDAGMQLPDAGEARVLAVDAAFTVDEDGQASGQLAATTDAGLPLTFALQQGPAQGTATVSSSGTFTYAPAADFFGIETFTFRVGDGASLSLGTVTATVTAINDPPLITGQLTLSAAEDTARTIQLGDLTVTDVDDTFPSGFTLQLAAGANYALAGAVLTPAADFSGSLAVPVTVTDGSGATSAPFTLSVLITPVNDAPVITAQSALSTAEETALTVTAADLNITDVDSTGFTLALTAGPDYTVNGATLTPALDFTGTLLVPVRVSDGSADSNLFTLTVTVTPVNDAPVITGQNALSTLEEAPFSLWLADLIITDVDSTTFTLTVNAGSNYTVSGATVTPAPDFTGTLSIPVTVSDGSASSNAFAVSVTVTNVNDAPLIIGQNAVNTAEDTARTLTLADLQVNDVDDNFPAGFTLQLAAGANYTLAGAVLTPALDFVGTLSVPVTVRDAANAISNSFLLSVSVTTVNDAPLITGQNTITTAEDTSRALTLADLTITDVDNPPPTGFSLSVGAGANYTVSGTTLTPALDFSGTLSVPVTVSDGTNDSNPFTVSVTVTAVNDAPVITGQNPVTTAEDTARALTAADLVITDVDSSSFTLTLFAGSNYTVSGTTLTPAANFSGTLSVPVQVSDGSSSSNLFSLTVTVTAVNDAPVITGQNPVTTAEDTARALTVADLVITDVDSSSFTLTVNPGANYTVSGTTVTPTANYNGLLSVPVTVSDGSASSNQLLVSLTVTPVNDPPVLTGQFAITTAEDTARTVTMADLAVTDVDNPPPTGFSVTLIAGTNYTVSGATLTPALNFFGTLSVPVRVSDGAASSNTFTLTVTVTSVNDAPVAAADSYATNGNTLLTVPAGAGVLVNDTDVESPTSSLVVTTFDASSVRGGTVSVAANGSFTYLPRAGEVNTDDTFTYTVLDPNGGSRIGTVTVSSIAPRVWYVDSSRTTGDGRSVSPFPTLASAITASGAGDTLFLYAGTYLGPAVLKANQRLVGHPAGLSLPTSNYTISAGARPSITLPFATAPVVQLASGVEVTQIGVNVPNGVAFSASATTGGLVDNVILNLGAVGFQLQAATGLTLQNLSASGLVDSVLRVPDGSYVDGLTVRDSTFNNIGNAVGDRAFDFGSGYLTGNGQARGTVLLQNLSVTANGQDGLFLESAGHTGSLVLDNVDLFAPNNGGFGLLVRADGSSTLSVTVQNGSLIEVGTGGDALNLAAEGMLTSNLTVLVTDSTLRAATAALPDDGLRATADGLNSRLNLRVINTAITNFNGRGIAVSASGAGALLQAVVAGVTLQASGVGTPLSSGILVETITSTSSGSVRASVTNSQVNVRGGPALMARARASGLSRLDLIAQTNNTFSTTSASAPGVDLGALNTALGCLALSGNTVSGGAPLAGQLTEGATATLQLEGTAASATAQFTGANTISGGVLVEPGVSLVPLNTCLRPTN